MQRSGYCSGEYINIKTRLENNSDKTMKLRVKLLQVKSNQGDRGSILKTSVSMLGASVLSGYYKLSVLTFLLKCYYFQFERSVPIQKLLSQSRGGSRIPRGGGSFQVGQVGSDCWVRTDCRVSGNARAKAQANVRRVHRKSPDGGRGGEAPESSGILGFYWDFNRRKL